MRVASARAKAPSYDPGEEEDEASDLYDLDAFAEAVGRGVPSARTAVGTSGKAWYDFLAAYTAATAAQRTPPRIGPLTCAPRTVREDQEARLTAATTPGEVERAWFVLGEPDGDDTMIIGRTSLEPDERGRLSETWDGFWFEISDGRNAVVCPLTDLEEVEGKEGEFVAQVPGEYRRARQRTWRDVTLRFYLREKADGSATGRLTAAYEDGKYGPREVTIRAGDRVRPLYEEIDAKGEESYIYSNEPEDQLIARSTNGISLTYALLARGEWRVGFVVSDHAGNLAQRWTDVTLDR